MLAICFWPIQIKNSYQNHMKINRYAFTFPNGVWLLSMEFQEIQTSSQGTSSLFLSAKKLSCCLFPRAQTRKCLSIPFLQSSSRKCCWKRLQNEAFQTKPKKLQVQEINFWTRHPSTLEETDFLKNFVGKLHPCPPVHRFGRSWPGKFRISFPHVLSTQNKYLTSLWCTRHSIWDHLTNLDAMVF